MRQEEVPAAAKPAAAAPVMLGRDYLAARAEAKAAPAAAITAIQSKA